MNIKEITDAIIARHHSFLRRELPRLTELLSSIRYSNDCDASTILEAEQLYTKVRSKIEAHLRDEETLLFPAGIALEENTTPPESNLDLRERLDEMEIEHENCGKALVKLEQMLTSLAEGPKRDAALVVLRDLRDDLDVHVEKENTLVHPRLFQLLADASASSPEAAQLIVGTQQI